MLKANVIENIMQMSKFDLVKLLDKSGYSMCVFEDVIFKGINVDNAFVFECYYYDEGGWGFDSPEDLISNVYVKVDNNGELTAEF